MQAAQFFSPTSQALPTPAPAQLPAASSTPDTAQLLALMAQYATQQEEEDPVCCAQVVPDLFPDTGAERQAQQAGMQEAQQLGAEAGGSSETEDEEPLPTQVVEEVAFVVPAPAPQGQQQAGAASQPQEGGQAPPAEPPALALAAEVQQQAQQEGAAGAGSRAAQQAEEGGQAPPEQQAQQEGAAGAGSRAAQQVVEGGPAPPAQQPVPEPVPEGQPQQAQQQSAGGAADPAQEAGGGAQQPGPAQQQGGAGRVPKYPPPITGYCEPDKLITLVGWVRLAYGHAMCLTHSPSCKGKALLWPAYAKGRGQRGQQPFLLCRAQENRGDQSTVSLHHGHRVLPVYAK